MIPTTFHFMSPFFWLPRLDFGCKFAGSEITYTFSSFDFLLYVSLSFHYTKKRERDKIPSFLLLASIGPVRSPPTISSSSLLPPLPPRSFSSVETFSLLYKFGVGRDESLRVEGRERAIYIAPPQAVSFHLLLPTYFSLSCLFFFLLHRLSL